MVEDREIKGDWKKAEGKAEESWGKADPVQPEDGRDTRLEKTRERYGQGHDAEGRGHPEDQPLPKP